MELDPFLPQVDQPALFKLGETSTGALELFPEVWITAEALAFSDMRVRQAALERLLDLGAARLSPLVAYLLATRLNDPDIDLRCRVIQALGEVLTRDRSGNTAPEAVRQVLSNYLARMRTREIYALLQAAVHDPEVEPQAALLLKANPYAGRHLADVLAERRFPLSVRCQAARFIGLVGYVDAIPTLERVVLRLESRLNGQQVMPFIPTSGTDETILLPDIQSALAILRSP